MNVVESRKKPLASAGIRTRIFDHVPYFLYRCKGNFCLCWKSKTDDSQFLITVTIATELLGCLAVYIAKGKTVPLQNLCGPKDSRKFRFPDFITTAQDGGKVVSLTHRPPLTPGNTPGTHVRG